MSLLYSTTIFPFKSTRGPASPLPGLAGALPRASIPVSCSILVFVYICWTCLYLRDLCTCESVWLVVGWSQSFTIKTEICIYIYYIYFIYTRKGYLSCWYSYRLMLSINHRRWRGSDYCVRERWHAESGFILYWSFEPCCLRLNSNFICSCEFVAVCLCALPAYLATL